MNYSEKILDAMKAEAKRLGIESGAGGFLCVENDEDYLVEDFYPVDFIVGSGVREPDDPDDTGVNFIAIMSAKRSEMLVTGKDSGIDNDRKPMKGEVGYRGGIVRSVVNYDGDEFLAMFYFSGGTEAEDVLISMAGYQALKDWLENCQKLQDLADEIEVTYRLLF